MTSFILLLTVLPIKQLGFSLLKAEFWDAVYLRYGLPLKQLPSNCGSSKTNTVQHALLCRKGGLVALRHPAPTGVGFLCGVGLR